METEVLVDSRVERAFVLCWLVESACGCGFEFLEGKSLGGLRRLGCFWIQEFGELGACGGFGGGGGSEVW